MDYSSIFGSIFGELTVISQTGVKDYLVCRCACGREKTVRLSHLRGGTVKSCGCLLIRRPREVHGKHLMSTTREHKTWYAMVLRCTNPNMHAYPDYGGRGISVCDRWLGENGFKNFLADMGPKPVGMTIERNNNDLGYSPENCRWATQREQVNNRRTNHFLSCDGRRLTLAQWGIVTGISRKTISERLRRGWNTDQALHSALRKRLSAGC